MVTPQQKAFCILRNCRLTGYFIINMWKCYLLFELPCIHRWHKLLHSVAFTD
jgi:hypothetical protein